MRKLFKLLKGFQGYTLTEMTAVIAATAIITAVALPVALEQVNQGRHARAREDVIRIIGTITKFTKDTEDMPMRRVAMAADPSPDNAFFFTVLLSSKRPNTATPTGGLPPAEVRPPQDNTNGDFLSGFNAGRISSFEAHFYTDLAADVLGGVGDANGRLYNPSFWRGPYISRGTLDLDPWGHSYVVFLRGVREDTLNPSSVRSPFKSWVISAGPNGVLETIPTEDFTRGDDVGEF